MSQVLFPYGLTTVLCRRWESEQGLELSTWPLTTPGNKGKNTLSLFSSTKWGYFLGLA